MLPAALHAHQVSCHGINMLDGHQNEQSKMLNYRNLLNDHPPLGNVSKKWQCV